MATEITDGGADPGCVMVVDDDREVRQMLRLALEYVGYQVEAARNGAEALERLRGGLRPALILLDLMMPDMSGWEFRDAQVHDSELPETPVVVLSGVERIDKESRRLGADEYIKKPVSIPHLLTVVKRYCGEIAAEAKN